MSRLLGARRRNRLPFALVGMLVLIVVAERYVVRRDRDFSTVWATAWARTAEAAAREAPRCDVLAFGDSLIKHAVIPRVIDDRLGRKTYNLAVFNGEAPTSYFLFRRALNAGSRPSAVLMDGELLEDNPLTRTRLWPELVNPIEAIELAREAGDANFLASILVAKALPSVKARFEIRNNVTAALRGEVASSRFELVPSLRNWDRNRGAYVVPARITAQNDPFPKMLADTNYLPATWSCDRINAYYVVQFLKLAAERKIPVYWLWPPVHPEVQSRRERGGRDAIYAAFLERLAQRFPNLIVVDGRRARYAPTAMHDATHLNRIGAVAYSDALAEILAQAPRSGSPVPDRWVALPPFRDPNREPPVEDIDQSILALKEARKLRKK